MNRGGSGASPLSLRSSASPAVRFLWSDMSAMEPTWYEAETPLGTLSLKTNWEETEWVLCDGDTVLHKTGEPDDVAAMTIAEKWIADRSASEDRTEQSEAPHETD
jgi:hypothetical protein